MIHVVVSCTDRKSVEPVACLRASTLPRTNFETRLSTWIERLHTPAPLVTARTLYQGEHWTVAQKLAERGLARVWVSSAGYGLIGIDAPVQGYQATFATQNAESVTLSTSRRDVDDERSRWWDGLQTHRRQNNTTLAELLADGPLIVAASKPYLAAMENELLQAESGARGRLIVSTTGDVPQTLRAFRTPGNGSLRTVLGGSMQAVNARLAAKIVDLVDESVLSTETANEAVRGLIDQARPLDQFDRERLTDAEVTRFIKTELRTSKSTSCSALLRTLRDRGMACEQSRFHELCKAARGAA